MALPGEQRVKLGDLISIDVGVIFDGFCRRHGRPPVMVGVTDRK
jgi:hypothetical protein